MAASRSMIPADYVGWLLVLWVCVGTCVAQQTNCDDSPDVAVVVVASVFGTLAVVALALGIAFFLIRRRNGGVVFAPKQTRKQNASPEEGGGQRNSQRDSCYVNPAFSVQEAAEVQEGQRKKSPNKLSTLLKKSLKKESQKTWASLPGQEDFSDELHRQGSCGSLDTNVGPETVSVWLQSQDIIGLGFNISGNMRDGIYVSQVHSRGPAVESGKIQVGDRIMSVTIAYENIVYEDALTLLSYASPYPVQVTLQKERAGNTDSRSGTTEQINHPLYRSQSLDALHRIGREPLAKTMRTQSEMMSETRRDLLSKLTGDKKAKALSQTYPGYTAYMEAMGRADVDSDVMVHATEVVDGEAHFGGDQHMQETMTVTKSGVVEYSPRTEDEAGALAARKKSRLDTEAAREFASLMDQVQDPNRNQGDKETGNRTSVSPKTPPSKPERKKKPSNASIVSLEESAAALESMVGQIEAIQSTTTTGQAHSSPGNAGNQEEEIRASILKRDVENQKAAERSDSPGGFVTIDLSDNAHPSSPQEGTVEVKAGVASIDTQTDPFPSKGRDKSKDREAEKERKRKEKEKKPVLDEEELERLIAMNSFPPGSQGLAGIQAGGKQGGVLDDFLPKDLAQQALNSMPQPTRSRKSSSSSEASSLGNRKQRGAVAFEVREDMLTGRPMSVDITRSRNSSASPSRSESRDRTPRSQSVVEGQQQKPQGPEDKENREDLDWSGTRLVRVEPFSDIPHDDSLSDWTDKNKVHDVDDNSNTSGKHSTADANPDSDSEMDPPRLTVRDVFKARENLANMSDLSNSISSSRSSSPAVTNGPAEGVVPAVSSVPGVKTATKDLPPGSDSNANSKTVAVSVTPGAEDDMDC